MRNDSEAIVRPKEAMTIDAMEKQFQGMTLRTTFRAWFLPLDIFDEYDDADGRGPYLCRGHMHIRGAEADAAKRGTHIDYEISKTDYDCNIVAIRNGSVATIDLYEPDAMYAIEVLQTGIDCAETLTVGCYDEVVADPGAQCITIEGIELDQNDVEQLTGVFERWLAKKI